MLGFSQNWPTGQIQSLSRNVCPSNCVFAPLDAICLGLSLALISHKQFPDLSLVPNLPPSFPPSLGTWNHGNLKTGKFKISPIHFGPICTPSQESISRGASTYLLLHYSSIEWTAEFCKVFCHLSLTVTAPDPPPSNSHGPLCAISWFTKSPYQTLQIQIKFNLCKKAVLQIQNVCICEPAFCVNYSGKVIKGMMCLLTWLPRLLTWRRMRKMQVKKNTK